MSISEQAINKISLRFIVLSFYIIVSFCSVFNVIGTEAQLLLFLLLLIFNLDKIKGSTIGLLLPLVTINLLSFFAAGNFDNGFWDPLKFVFKYINLFQVFVLTDIFSVLDEKERKVILNIYLICIIITNLISIIYSIGDPNAIRYRSDAYPLIINFNQFYSLPILISAILVEFVFKKNYNLLMFTALVSSILVIVNGSLATGLFLTILGISLVLIFWLSKIIRVNFFVILFSIILLFILIRSQIVTFLRFMATLTFFPSLTRSKILVAASVLETFELSSTLLDRQAFTMNALNSFNNNSFFGISYMEYGFGTISGHADWFDILAVNGVIGFVLLGLAMFSLVFRINKKLANDYDQITFFIGIILFIVLGFVNPNLSIEVLLTLFIIIPFLFSEYDESKVLSSRDTKLQQS